MKKLLLILAVTIAAMISAKAQNTNMEIVFNFDKCEYYTEATGHYEIESVFYEKQPQGFDKFWETRKKELCGIFQTAANQAARGKYLFGGYTNSPYYVEVTIKQIDPDGEIDCKAKIIRRSSDGEYSPTIAEYDLESNGKKSENYDNISTDGFRRAGAKLGKQMMVKKPVR